ncbi:PI-PLC X domain-containing protein 1-like [Plectropomus leopardus]|uniref:PI-PLC X domain-containing protein 1-like n=1 Tax=Plectropomus leopardus TaxID=160734 RepID=UPI001C4ADC1A|nr:PI-PLC X domain-containing protein 1-like [Plectropomus leopardus]
MFSCFSKILKQPNFQRKKNMKNKDRGQHGGNPDWMSRLPEELLDVPLWNLSIPGSHDTMSFCLDVSSPVLKSQPRFIRVSDKLFPCWTRRCVSRWATTQVPEPHTFTVN